MGRVWGISAFICILAGCTQFDAAVIGPGELSSSLRSQSIGSANGQPGYDVIIIAGQSNAVGYGCGPYTDVSKSEDARILQVDPSNNVIPASDALYFNPGHANLVGLGMTFARLYAQRLPPNRKVIVVPTAFGGTSVLEWDNRDEGIDFTGTAPFAADSTFLYDRMIARTKAALAYGGTQNRVTAILWHQGENDYAAIKNTGAGWSAMHNWMPSVPAYQARLEETLNLFRRSLDNGAAVPLIAGHLGSFWARQNGADPGGAVLGDFNRGIAAAAARIPNSAVVSAIGLNSDAEAGCSADTAHFSAASEIELGKRYFASYSSLNFAAAFTVTPQSPAPPAPPISLGHVQMSVDMSCNYFNPDAIKRLSTETISWLGTIQPSGLTLHEQYVLARQAGYSGAFGFGEHNLALAKDPQHAAAFNSLLQQTAGAPVPPYATFAAHHIGQRAMGYKGLWFCGGGACYLSGQCDQYGRRL
jgi:hypothetical protein